MKEEETEKKTKKHRITGGDNVTMSEPDSVSLPNSA
jgi:hypothetical protein